MESQTVGFSYRTERGAAFPQNVCGQPLLPLVLERAPGAWPPSPPSPHGLPHGLSCTRMGNGVLVVLGVWSKWVWGM